MNDLYNYKKIALICLCLNCLHADDMNVEQILINVQKFVERSSVVNKEDIEVELSQMSNDKLISFNGEAYHLEEKGEEIRNKILADYIHFKDVLAELYDSGEVL